jgi:hypothetical protein
VLGAKVLGAEFAARSFRTNLALLLRTECLVISGGTLRVAARFLSLNAKTLRAFAMALSRISRHRNCMPDDEYRRGKMNGWMRTERYLSGIMSAGFENWTVVDPGTNQGEEMHLDME